MDGILNSVNKVDSQCSCNKVLSPSPALFNYNSSDIITGGRNTMGVTKGVGRGRQYVKTERYEEEIGKITRDGRESVCFIITCSGLS